MAIIIIELTCVNYIMWSQETFSVNIANPWSVRISTFYDTPDLLSLITVICCIHQLFSDLTCIVSLLQIISVPGVNYLASLVLWTFSSRHHDNKFSFNIIETHWGSKSSLYSVYNTWLQSVHDMLEDSYLHSILRSFPWVHKLTQWFADFQSFGPLHIHNINTVRFQTWDQSP